MKYNPETHTISISVGELVETVCKKGSIDTRHGGIFTRALDGSRWHKRLQGRYGETYEAEVPLFANLEHKGISYHINGRADGIIYGPHGYTVDEIKTLLFPPALVNDEFMHPHLSQAVCYAYMLCESRDLQSITVQLTYYNYELDETNYIVRYYTKAELKSYIEGMLDTYHPFAQHEIHRRRIRLPSIREGKFPFSSLREGQRDFIKEGYRVIKGGNRLFVQAPTGIGKTISALYPAVKALSHHHCEKIFYFTAKGTAQTTAFDTAQKLCEHKMPLRTVILYAREKLCLIGKGSGDFCNPDDCPYAKGHYDRVRGALLSLLDSDFNGYDFRIIQGYAKKYNVCPYELSLDLAEYCDLLIGDCNYLFDPQVYLRRFFDQKGVSEKNRDTLSKRGYVLLIDEAHNLLDRARNMYSGRIYGRMFASPAKEIEKEDPPLAAALSRILLIMKKMRRLCIDNFYIDENDDEYGYYVSEKPINVLNEALSELIVLLEPRLPLYADTKSGAKLRDLFFELREFMKKMSFFSEGFIILVEIKRRDMFYRILCLDPCEILDQRMSCARSALLFSATLTPTDYFSRMLGGKKEAAVLDLPSPYDPAKLCITVMDKISTRHLDREANAFDIADIIATAVSAKRGNYIVYLPSYRFLSIIYEAFTEICPYVDTVMQQRQATQQQREAFIAQFAAERKRTLVGFCVLGGLYAEGIDLTGERLIGTIIVGTGIPQISLERNLLQAYYQERTENGFDYAYVYPGINRVLQAAGRVIRSEEDRGIIVLIDDRFASPQYRQLFPAHWHGLKYVGNINSLSTVLSRFWSSVED